LKKIIAHKKVDMTNDEYQMYRSICAAYDDVKSNRKGTDLFLDHFDVNGEGIITFVRPPNKRYSSLEVYCFLISLMVNQHLRICHEQTKTMVKEAEQKLKPLIDELTQLRDDLQTIKESSVEKSENQESSS
jgi:hypothetical protein